jgi:U3 small nucleolar RNA-associated protein 20
MQYLVGYPMGEARLEDHLKHVVLNVKYKYEEGRLSAIALTTAIIEKLPVELLEVHAQLFFLPLVLQFVNDDSKECRQALSDCLSRLLSRAPMEVVQSFYDYTERWALGSGPLKRTSLQLFGIFVDSRADFLKKGDTANTLIARLYDFAHDADDDEWEIQYFALLCLEKLSNSSFSLLLETQSDLWVRVVESLTNRHPWIKSVASRMVGAQLGTLDHESFVSNKKHFLVERPGLLYKVARNLCSHLDADEAEQNQELSAGAIKSLVWIVQAMKAHPELCYADENNDEDRNPVTWLMARLSNIAKPKGSKRRESIFKCFAAFVTVGGVDLVMPYLELILEPLHRSITESDKMMESIKNSTSRRKQLVEESEEATLAKDVLHVLEEACGDDSEAFLRAYGAVKSRAREKREQRKKLIATEAVVDPQASAMRKMKKHEQEKRRRKRKVEGHRQNRGGTAKRRHL